MTSPGREGVGGADKRAPEVNTLVAEDQGKAIPMTIDGGELQQSGIPPNTIPEASEALGSNDQPPADEGEEYRLHR